MNHDVKPGVRNLLARIGQRINAVITECNYIQTRRTSLRDTRPNF